MPPSKSRPYNLADVQPGDVLVVRTPPSLFGWLIRLGARLHGQPATVDHVVIAVERGADGRLWGIEAQPSGVRRVDCAVYASRWLLHNAAQPKTAGQRTQVCQLAAHLIGAGYDWLAILADAARALDLPYLLGDFGARPPHHVVCSSLAAWLYRRAGLAEPSGPQVLCEPCDWAEYIEREAWLA